MVEQWKEMYFPEMEKLVENQPTFLKQLSMLMLAFEKEVIKIQQYQQDIRTNLLLEQNKIEAKVKLKSIPKEKRTTKTCSSLCKLAEESPDIFSQTLREKRKLDDSMIASSPETTSPSTKKKINSSLTRITKLLKQSKVETSVSKQSNTDAKFIIDLDEMIEGTPDVKQNTLSPIIHNKTNKLANKSIKKKLFSRTGVKQQQNTTLTQMFDMYTATQDNNISQQENSLNANGHQSKMDNISRKDDSKLNTVTNKTPQKIDEPQVHVVDILADLREQSIEKENIPNIDETDPNATVKISIPKIYCKYCNFNGSPCPKHRFVQKAKEPDETFAGFWDLNFTTMNEKARRNAFLQNCKAGTQDESIDFLKP